jgi:hypothetical protein
MNLAYADPPYLGCCSMYDHYHGDGTYPWDGKCWDDPATHGILVRHLSEQYDGWSFCMSSQSLRHILPIVGEVPYRVASWVKPFAAFKRNVRVAYTWEPVLFTPGRDRSSEGASISRDHLSERITLQRGLTGVKPQRFNRWVLDLMGYVDGDDVTDVFPGSAGMARTLTQGVLL